MEYSEQIIIMGVRIDNMEKKLEVIDKKLDEMMVKLLDPDDGFVTRVNKNTYFRHNMNEITPLYDELLEEFKQLRSWKESVTKALWVIFTAIVGVIVKLILFP